MAKGIMTKRSSHQMEAVVYQIRLRGHLNERWADWFGGMKVTLETTGDTVLTGPVVDQAALHGLLRRVRDLGMPLLSVIHVTLGATHPPEDSP